MQDLTINIVAFDIPYPADYGGTIDIFHKIRTLKKFGVNIILHCFKYNKDEQPELDKYCMQVFYYKRKKGIRYAFSRRPYIVATRNHKQLIRNLKENDHPIIFEGLHSCFFLNADELNSRTKIVRMHNVEQDYYEGLQRASKNALKKIYYQLESRKIREFEPILAHADAIISISQNDQKYFSSKFNNVHFIPAFHPFDDIVAKPGKGSYFLYHGNLSVEENVVAANFLLDNVFSKTTAKILIAGKAPNKNLAKKIERLKNVDLISDPSHQKMNELLENAQGCIIPTFQGTGLKLKLLVSLYSSRFVLTNLVMVENTSLESLCELANSADEFISLINKITNREFNQEQLNNRIEKLRLFNNEFNGAKFLKIINSL